LAADLSQSIIKSLRVFLIEGVIALLEIIIEIAQNTDSVPCLYAFNYCKDIKTILED